MGQNLSLEEEFADTSGVVWAPEDRANTVLLGVIWLCSAYGVGMVWCAVGLLRRWAGRDGEKGAGLASLLAALLLSSGWPVVVLYCYAMSGG